MSVAAIGLRDQLTDETLSDDERDLVASMLSKSSRRCIDRLIEARLERSLCSAVELQASADGNAAPEPPRVILIRTSMRVSDSTELLKSSMDVAGMGPGEPIDALIDQILGKDPSASTGPPADDDLDLRVEVAGVEVNLLDGSVEEAEQVRDGIATLASRLSLALELEREPDADQLEERDLSGMLLGGKYRVKRLKGKGGFGNVYEAVDEMLGARVAIKVLNRRTEQSPRAIEHFLREAKLLTGIDHENIVRWITFDRTDDGLHYFVMEYLGGEELEEILQREGRLAPKRAAEILLRVLSALRNAHQLEAGALLHLDLKPDNVFVLPAIDREGAERVKVIDFGISQHVGAEARQVTEPTEGTASSVYDEDPAQSISATVTREISRLDRKNGVTRVRGGTLLYASPEQIEHLAGRETILRLDGRSDLYSLGIMAFRMLTGDFPFKKCQTAEDVISNHLEVEPQRLAATGNKIPRKLAQFVDRCLAKDRDGRWSDSSEAFEALDAFVNPRAQTSKVIVGVAAALLAIFAAFWVQRDQPAVRLALRDAITRGPAETIHLGVDSPAHELVWEETPQGTGASTPVLIGSDGNPLLGWTVTRVDDAPDSLHIGIHETQPPPAEAPTRLQARVALYDVDGKQRVLSIPFDLELTGSWSIAPQLRVADYNGERTLDPRGRQLDVQLNGEESGLSSIVTVEVMLNGSALARTTNAVGGPAPLVHYYLPLDELAGRIGQVDLEVVVSDRAGRTQRISHRLELAPPPARIDAARTGIRRGANGREVINPVKDDYTLGPDCSLSLATRGAAQVTVWVEQDGAASDSTRTRPERSGFPRRTYELADDVKIIPLRDLGLDEMRAAFSGKLVIELSEEQYVDRLEAEPLTTELTFDFYPSVPELTVRLTSSDDTRAVLALLQESTVYVNWSGPALLTVERSVQNRHLQVEALLLKRDDGRWQEVDRKAGQLEPGIQGRSTDLPIEFPKTGTFQIQVRAFDEADGQQGAEVGEVRTFDIAIDTLAPDSSPTLTGIDSSGLVTPASTPALALIVADDSPLASIHWRLTGPDGTSGQGYLQTHEPAPGSHIVTNWPAMWSGALAQHDGDYELDLTSTDLAGNSGVETVRWSLALAAPVVRLTSPVRTSAAGTLLWPVATGQVRAVWNVCAIIEDPNPIERVAASIINLETNARHNVALQFNELTDAYEVSESERPPVNPRWSMNDVRIVVEAWDAGNNHGVASEEARLPAIEKKFHPRIVATNDDADEMIFVPGNERFQYVAGGRKNKDQAKSPWNVPIARGELKPYYLDRTEVSCRAYLAFVANDDGYANAKWWASGSSPTEGGRQALLDRLGKQHVAELPVTGITWPEAAAFARFHRKRLPTIVEWEYAVRGGEDYRTHSLGNASLAELSGAIRLSVAGTRALDAAWAVGQSDDVLASGAGAGLCDLVANVREWTSTPDSFFEGAPRPKAHFRDHTAWLLRTPEMVISLDLDGDHQEDHIAIQHADDSIQVWHAATRNSTHLGNTELTPAPRHVTCADVDGDGDLDIVVTVAGGRTVEFLGAAGQFSNKRTRQGVPRGANDVQIFPYRWVVGSSFKGSGFTFLDRSQQRATSSSDDVGFRCALDAERALELEEKDLWRAAR